MDNTNFFVRGKEKFASEVRTNKPLRLGRRTHKQKQITRTRGDSADEGRRQNGFREREEKTKAMATLLGTGWFSREAA